ncbi:hypothetical protein OLX02_12800 [Novosphingobium sp. KCTC 2891]|uniref:hypothetical protein n=1 Tax=Novosphingobium sp. KCTC 2891 TaxID=2989730 RepID=UPI002222A23E|nr:hypothetical protein [Novosphingobium sp. KCTC 2891]MCW1383701.1 hypothetical protein [Novosphingobium sp. KCTC 2891]
MSDLCNTFRSFTANRGWTIAGFREAPIFVNRNGLAAMFAAEIPPPTGKRRCAAFRRRIGQAGLRIPLRRTKAALIYRPTGNLRAARMLPGRGRAITLSELPEILWEYRL